MKLNDIMAVTLGDFVQWFEELIPPAFQESYDNSGLQVGDHSAEVSSVLLTVDVTPAVMEEAAAAGCNLVVSHHPLIFKPLRSLVNGSDAQRSVAAAIRKDIAVYSAHTSLDNSAGGVSHVLAEKIGLQDIMVLAPLEGRLSKIVTFVPREHAGAVRDALFAAGAGVTGNYDRCSFNVTGEGTFRAGQGAEPFAGEVGMDHTEPEVRIEVVVPSFLTGKCVRALLDAHPYEEVAYDIIALQNGFHGAGAIGRLPAALPGEKLLERLKKLTGIPAIRYSGDMQREVSTVALCGGSGSEYIAAAARAGADAFLTADIRYHAFAEAPHSMLVADIGHYESEKFSLELLHKLIQKKFPNFALRFSETKTNPINFYQ
jgi:dinuclear metal center YbgI/SA1388 family protein